MYGCLCEKTFQGKLFKNDFVFTLLKNILCKNDSVQRWPCAKMILWKHNCAKLPLCKDKSDSVFAVIFPINLFTMGHLCHSTKRLFEQHYLCRGTSFHRNHFAEESFCPKTSLHRSYFAQKPLSTGITLHRHPFALKLLCTLATLPRNNFPQAPLCTWTTLHRNQFVEEPICRGTILHRNCFA